MVVVEADNVDSPTLEEMILGIGLITAGSNRARLIITLHDIGQMLSKQGIRRHLFAVSQRRGIMPCIQNQVSLLQRQFIGICRRPLFQHFITNRPHHDTGMITVALHQIRKVALMPFVEEAGIIVLRLLAPPHVKRLVHHDESHRIAHIQQFRGWRIVRRTDGIHAHCLQFHQLTVKGIFIEGSTKATEVMMLAYAVNLHWYRIE